MRFCIAWIFACQSTGAGRVSAGGAEASFVEEWSDVADPWVVEE